MIRLPRLIPVLCAGLLLTLGSAGIAEHTPSHDWQEKRDRLGKEDKYRFLVDKVLSRANGWVLTATHVREVSEAGFNVISPRMGAEDLERCRREAEWAEQAGMFYVPWMRATLPSATGERFVWSNGYVQEIASPNSDELWDWMTDLLLGHARLSLEVPSLLGTFLDFENYLPDAPVGTNPFAYYLSYDDRILAAFGKKQGMEIPDLEPAMREPWIVEQGLEEEFESFQVDCWRDRCRALREAIDAINPHFRLIVYPAWESLFLEKAVYREWGTEKAPLVLGEYHTYGRRGWLRQKEALHKSGLALVEGMATARRGALFHHFMGGVDPLTTGADPEYCAKNAVLLSMYSDGYWIFYEGPRYEEDHDDYFAWFAKANLDIASGEFQLADAPREEPDKLSAATYLDSRPDRLHIATLGVRYQLHEDLRKKAKFDMHGVKGPDADYLNQFDALFLEKYRLPPEDPWTRDLRKYVEEGGGVLLVYEAAVKLATLFPELVEGTDPSWKDLEPRLEEEDKAMDEAEEYPPYEANTEGCLLEPAASEFPDLLNFPEVRGFTPVSSRKATFRPGPAGTTVLIDCYGEAQALAGQLGQGKVVFLGPSYSWRLPEIPGDDEFDFLVAVLRWLATD